MTDKAWLKEELLRDLMRFNGNPNMTDYELGIASGIRTAINLTEKLDEPEITFKQAHDKLREESILSEKSFDYYWNCINGNVEIDELGNLLVPKQDKPEKAVIPKFVADWIDTHNLYGNNPLREYRDLENDFNEGWTDEEDAAVYHWVNENPYAFIDALRYGYEVEKELYYYVAFEGEFNLLYVTHVDIYGEDGKFNYSSVFDKKHALKFTDKSKAEYLADFLGAIVVEETK